MGTVLLIIVVALVVGGVIFGVMTLVSGGDPGLRPAEPDVRAHPLPGDRPLVEGDLSQCTFDLAWRGYRMAQVDQTMRRLAYDIGYKSELIQVLEAEVSALRDGRVEDADRLARARAAALGADRASAPEDASAPDDITGASPTPDTQPSTGPAARQDAGGQATPSEPATASGGQEQPGDTPPPTATPDADASPGPDPTARADGRTRASGSADGGRPTGEDGPAAKPAAPSSVAGRR